MLTLPEKEKLYPFTGSINAIIVFVQFVNDNSDQMWEYAGDTDYRQPTYNNINVDNRESPYHDDVWGVQCVTDNPDYEWPSDLPSLPQDPARRRLLPAWAANFIDAPGSNTITPGSLTDYFHDISKQQFNLRGKVVPFTYITEHSQSYYIQNFEQSLNTYGSALEMILDEIVNYLNNNSSDLGLNLNDSIWDQYVNGDNNSNTYNSDGILDLLILHYRDHPLKNYSEFSHGNAYARLIAENQPFNSTITLGNFGITRNSGILSAGFKQKTSANVIAHELGHNQSHRGHTFVDPLRKSSDVDSFSNMHWGPSNSIHLGVQERIKFEYANIEFINVNDINGDFVSRELFSSGVYNNTSLPDVIWLMNGSTPNEGDIIIESRKRNNWWNILQVPSSSKRDLRDFYLPNEGIYVHVYVGSNVPVKMFGSLHAGKYRRDKFGVSGNHGFNGDNNLIPMTQFEEKYTGDDESNSLLKKIGITHIVSTINGHSFKIWKDFLKSTSTTKPLKSNDFTLSDKSLNRSNMFSVKGRFIAYNGFDVNTFTMQGYNGAWHGIRFEGGKTYSIDSGNFLDLDGYSGGYPYEKINIEAKNATVIITNSDIFALSSGSKNRGPLLGATSSSGDIKIYNSRVMAENNVGVKADQNGYVELFENKLKQVSNAKPVILADNGGIIISWKNPSNYNGLNQVQGNHSGIVAQNGAYVDFGNGYYNARSRNHFINNARTITAYSGSTLFVEYNYWTSGYPVIQPYGGNIIYTGTSMGYPNTSGMDYEANMDYQIERKSVNESSITIRNPLQLIQNLRSFWNNSTSLKRSLKQIKSEVDNQTYSKAIFLLDIALDNKSEISKIKSSIYNKTEKAFAVNSAIFNQIDKGDLTKAYDIYKTYADDLYSGQKEYYSHLFYELTLDENSGSASVDSSDQFSLKNYPNPFNPATNIQFTLSQTTPVSGRLYNIIGKLVMIINERTYTEGTHVLRIDASSLSSGTYFFKIKIGESYEIFSLQLIK